MINKMNLVLLTNADSAIFHCLFYTQTKNIKFRSVVVKGNESDFYLLKQYSEVNNFKLFFVDDLNSEETINIIKKLKPKILLLMCSQVIIDDIISIPRYTINIHSGILPRYRGLDVKRWAILEDGEIGITAHLVDESLDNGPIIFQKKLNIFPGDTVESISEKNYYQNRYEVLVEAIRKIENGNLSLIKQKSKEGRRYFWMHPKIRTIVDKKLELIKE